MTIPDDKLLDWARTSGDCEHCKQWQLRLEPHHCFKPKGMGGGSTINDPANIIAVCRRCHDLAERSTAINFDMKCIIAKREGATIDEIQAWIYLVLNTLKEHEIPAKSWAKVTA